jgi:signal peptidase I
MDTHNIGRPHLSSSAVEAVLDIWSQAGERHIIAIAGHSMLPLIQPGDRLLVLHGSEGVRRGDVIVFWRAGRLIAHRVLSIFDSCPGLAVVTKGDNAPWRDQPLEASEIVGRVLAIERDDKRVDLDTPTWRVLSWLIAASTLACAKLYDWCHRANLSLFGPRPNCFTTCLRRGMPTLISLGPRVLRAVGCWWTERTLSPSRERSDHAKHH